MARRTRNPGSDSEGTLREASRQFWTKYYDALKTSHTALGRPLDVPIKDRNLTTTASEHISVFEDYWRAELARQLGVPRDQVGARIIKFRDHRTKSFDVCYPLEGDPKILISVKSMQNAYRNITNRVEEALGDSAVLRVYRHQAVFGFFFFLLDGSVARGRAAQGKKVGAKDESGRPVGISPFLTLVEDGGDFFSLDKIEQYRKPEGNRPGRESSRQDVVERTALSLLDLVAPKPTPQAGIHYDAMAFAPTTIRAADAGTRWNVDLSPVDQRLEARTFVSKLIETAKLRRLI